MALPSAVTLASVTVVVAAGVGLAAAAAQSLDSSLPDHHASGPVTTTAHHEAKSDASPHRGAKHSATKHSGTEHTGRRAHRDDHAVPKVLVEVYNNSSITGLAAEKAALLEGAGWKVAATDNWTGQIPASTVYFPDGLRHDATKLASTLDIDRLRPAVAPMQFDRLTVILVSS